MPATSRHEIIRLLASENYPEAVRCILLRVLGKMGGEESLDLILSIVTTRESQAQLVAACEAMRTLVLASAFPPRLRMKLENAREQLYQDLLLLKAAYQQFGGATPMLQQLFRDTIYFYSGIFLLFLSLQYGRRELSNIAEILLNTDQMLSGEAWELSEAILPRNLFLQMKELFSVPLTALPFESQTPDHETLLKLLTIDPWVSNLVLFMQHQMVLKQHPLFSSWPDEVLMSLTQCFKPYESQPGEKIAVQGDRVHSIYFIIAGKVELSHENPDGTSSVIATRLPGEAIGLAESGIFSNAGVYTATVTALTPVTFLQLTVEDFQKILQNYPQFKQEFETVSVDLLKMRLIKVMAPTTEFSMEELRHLMHKITEKDVPASSTVFHQGEEGDYCYLIRSGQIAIDKTTENGAITRLAVLTTPMIFGETALLLSTTRNASAIAITDCKLFALSHRDVLEALKLKTIATDELLLLEHKNPERNPAVVASLHPSADGRQFTVLTNPANNKYFQLDEVEISVWQQLNGNNSVREIIQLLKRKAPLISIIEIYNLILALARDGFVTIEKTAPLSLWKRAMERVKGIMEAKHVFENTDRWFTKTYEAGITFLFSKPAKVIFSLLGVLGLFTFICVYSPGY